MPKIREYAPSIPRLNPSDRALAAWETAGRRVGPLYNEAAQDIKDAGRARGDMERMKTWPFDIYALREYNAPKVSETSSTTTTERGTAATSGFNVGRAARTDGRWLGDGPANGVIDPRSYNTPAYTDITDYASDVAEAGGNPDAVYNAWNRAHGEVSAGAVGVSRLARADRKSVV